MRVLTHNYLLGEHYVPLLLYFPYKQYIKNVRLFQKMRQFDILFYGYVKKLYNDKSFLCPFSQI